MTVLQCLCTDSRLWAKYGGGAEGLWCGGWVRAGAAAAPYSLRLLPGTLALLPPRLE